MRCFLFAVLCLAGCSQEAAAPELAIGTYVGEGRSQLCIAGKGAEQRAGVISYGAGDANCSASGRLTRVGADWMLIPRGEGDCRIPFSARGNQVRIGVVPGSCAYYCGPGAALANRRFALQPNAGEAADAFGDPLC